MSPPTVTAEQQEPGIEERTEGGFAQARLVGAWTASHAGLIETLVDALPGKHAEERRLTVELSGVTRLDTLGALVIGRLMREAGSDGLKVELTGARPEHSTLIEAVSKLPPEAVVIDRRFQIVDILADVGRTMVGFWRDLAQGTSFLGEVMVALLRTITGKQRFRGPSLVHQVELIAFRGAPIIILISFLVGCIVAQQGIFQLNRFGASTFVVNLIGVLVLRELGVLLSSIMVAGRSGSAFTAEIGSMKMREEIDALRVMGLDPTTVLVVPRILALTIAMPILSFIASIAGLAGGGLTAWLYGGMTPEVFLSRLQTVVTGKDFAVGLIKAPFMALVIGLIACLEGLAVQGSAESLGRQVTASVVKAIFMVIVMDGLFAMFFAAIKL